MNGQTNDRLLIGTVNFLVRKNYTSRRSLFKKKDNLDYFFTKYVVKVYKM